MHQGGDRFGGVGKEREKGKFVARIALSHNPEVVGPIPLAQAIHQLRPGAGPQGQRQGEKKQQTTAQPAPEHNRCTRRLSGPGPPDPPQC